MQTGHWLNIKRNSNFINQILGLLIVCAVSIPILALTLISAVIYRALYIIFNFVKSKAP